nr:GNAT family N-acetyltransferase [Schumannella sp. 10F1B-5-1]
MPLEIRVDDLSGAATRALIAHHLDGMHDGSPEESIHALDLAGLQSPAITVWSAWASSAGASALRSADAAGGAGAEADASPESRLAGIGALKRLDATRGELKSMRVAGAFLGKGVGRAILRHIVAEAQAEGLRTLWLETGAGPQFTPAQRLYASEGFGFCGPFDGYVDDPLSVFMTRAI